MTPECQRAYKPFIDVTPAQLREARQRGPVSIDVEYDAFKQGAGFDETNSKFFRSADLHALALSGRNTPFKRNHEGGSLLGFVLDSHVPWTKYGWSNRISQRAALLDHGDVIDRAIAGEMRFVSIAIVPAVSERPTCSLSTCRAAPAVSFDQCVRGHVFGKRYANHGMLTVAEILWPASAKLRETSWVDEPACSDAYVQRIRLSRAAPLAKAAQPARAIPSTIPPTAPSTRTHPRLQPPTAEERAALIEAYFSDPRTNTTCG